MPLFDRLVTFMRFLHTSDLHLGRSLYDVNRDETFEKFLTWLTETIRTEAIDCLIIAGDVFDNATSSSSGRRRPIRPTRSCCCAMRPEHLWQSLRPYPIYANVICAQAPKTKHSRTKKKRFARQRQSTIAM